MKGERHFSGIGREVVWVTPHAILPTTISQSMRKKVYGKAVYILAPLHLGGKIIPICHFDLHRHAGQIVGKRLRL